MADSLFDERCSPDVQMAYGRLFRDPWLLRSRMPTKMAERRLNVDALHAIVILGGRCTFKQWIDTFLYMQRWRWYFARFAKTAEDREEFCREYDWNVEVWHRTMAMMGVEGVG
jgi:hypothetical protein